MREGKSTSRERGLPVAEMSLRGQTSRQEVGSDTFIERTVGAGHTCYLNSPVAAYNQWRLDPKMVGPARELRRRVRAALLCGEASVVVVVVVVRLVDVVVVFVVDVFG